MAALSTSTGNGPAPGPGAGRDAAAARPPTPPGARRRRFSSLPCLLLAPSVVVLAVVLGYPMVRLVLISLQRYRLRELISGRGEFVGLDSYRAVLGVAAGSSGSLAGGPAGGARGLVLVVRDLHRHPAARAAVAAAVAERPDAVVLELGVPVVDPGGRAWVASSGASAASVAAVARRLLGRPA